MSRIFISYRRTDSAAEAGRIYDYLENKFGYESIFKDVDTIDAGDDFRERLNEAVGQCQILLAVIGRSWLQAKDEAGRRRLDNPADWVRLEIETALQRKIRVIPILLEGVAMPTVSDLPEALQPLAYRNAARVRHDPDFRTDIGKVLKVIQRHFDKLAAPASVPSRQVVRPVASSFQSFTQELGGGVTLDMVAIPGGTFMMGSPSSEAERRSSEGPQHSVDVLPFWLGKYPVTQAQWQTVAALPKVEQNLAPSPAEFPGSSRPVEQVNWYESMEFCKRLSIKTGKAYRLPSEAEWEYACRAGTATPFHFGETITADLANYDVTESYAAGAKARYRKETTDVGNFPANAFGLYDMHGNVSEWCADYWHGSYKGAPNNGSAWLTRGLMDFRVLRGGSLLHSSRFCRSACRRYNSPDGRYYYGFRVARLFQDS
ncbi:MAG: SUMF1/EgtB/PvdO family nonheme iron enzyme [Phormidesmis sp.]